MKLFRTISSLLMAVLVLLASSSFYVGVHYCGGTIKAIAFLDEADGCGHPELPPCHRKVMESCCENDQVVHESQDIRSEAANVGHPLLSLTTIVHNTLVLAEIIPAVEINPIPYFSDHPPAFTGHDIIISFQSFLI
jgi:hypothetical protein